MSKQNPTAADFGEFAVNNFISEVDRLLRLEGITQTELASLLGVSQPTISRWWAGLVPIPSWAVFMLLGILQRRRGEIAEKLDYLTDACAGKVVMIRGLGDDERAGDA